jgi:hypothetical protein
LGAWSTGGKGRRRGEAKGARGRAAGATMVGGGDRREVGEDLAGGPRPSVRE